MHHNNLLSTWDDFTHALELRFGPSAYENHQKALFKLQQTSTVSEYQKEFEKVCNRVIGLPTVAILDCFISGLRTEIQHEMAITQPSTISQDIGLAKLIESKLAASRHTTSYPRHNHPKHHPPPQPPLPTTPLLPSPPTRLALPAPNPNTSLPIQWLSPIEMQARKAKGLCYNCDDRFHTGHRCKTKQFLLLLADEEPSDSTTPHTLDFF